MTVGTTDVARERLRGMWGAVAPSWGEHADAIDARAAAVTARMLALAAPATGERVLELACGAGGTGIAAAEIVGPTGEVVLTDVVEDMTAIAARRARARGLTHIATRVRDLDDIAEPDGSFDVVLCREGLMFATEPEVAAAGIRRVTRPGGRVAVAVWGPRTRNPWLGVIFDTVEAHTGSPVPPPGVPGPFSLEERERLARLLAGAGLEAVEVEEVEVPLEAASPDEWWDRATALAGPLALRLARMTEEESAALRSRGRDAVRPYASAGGLLMPGLSLVASGRVP